MADESKQQIPNVGGNGFIWILLVAAGTYFVAHQIPLEGSRPPTKEKSVSEQADVQDIDARLWQDPFAAVAEKLARLPELRTKDCPPKGTDAATGRDAAKAHCISPLDRSEANDAFVLVASVSAAPYSEDHEARRRTRYAVLAGLNAEGYVPVDPQHIGFYRTQAAQLPQIVPYEWFKLAPGRKSPPYGRILLLWFDEDALRESPLKQFAELLCPSTPTPPRWAKARILGPQTSTTLQAMVEEVKPVDPKDPSKGICPGKPRPQFYLSSATADDATLIPAYVARLSATTPPHNPPCLDTDTCLSEFFQEKGVELHRMIATDKALAGAIRDELSLRGIDNVKQSRRPSHIALVSEWDTVYGRALPATMARCLGFDRCQQANAAQPAWLHPYKYLRGLDGQLPDAGGASADNGSKDADSKQGNSAKNGSKARPDPTPQDRAEGQGQLDYLRRLGERIQQRDADLQREGQGGIQAVGVLGSDLYDKLLVLQALRPLLPNAWFFTTDLDALLLHPTSQKLTRNLLVASSFGLQLRPDIQGEIPPFRSSYQTAAFLATRVAVHNGEGPRRAWLKPPLLFEIGNSRTFQYAGQAIGIGTPIESEVHRSDHEQCKADLRECNEVQPLASVMYPQANMRVAVGVLCLALVLGLGLALTFPSLRRRIGRGADLFMGSSRSYGTLAARGLAVLVGAGVVFVGLAAAIHALWPLLANVLTDDGQPITLLEGTSVWPTVFLRAATLVLCIWLIADGWRRLDENLKKIVHKLHLVEMWRSLKAEQADSARRSSPWIRFTSNFLYRLPADEHAAHGNAAHGKGESSSDEVFRFWREYIYQGRVIARLYRVLAGVLVMGVLWVILAFVFGNPHPPTRGPVSLWAYQSVTFLLLFATLFLIFFVADTTWFCWRVVRRCRSLVNVWPQQTLQQFSHQLGLPESALYDWADLVFLSRRTKLITTLIYYPFLIIALLLISRSRLFANYGASIPDLVTMGVGLLIVSGCAVALRWSVETSRTKARRRLHDQMVTARKLNDGGRRAGQLQMLLQRIDELREGAFSPFSQQPLVRAMLLPLGSIGGTALIEYLLPSGFS
jgi:hypothetical protein